VPKHPLTLIEYNTLELHPLIIGNNWFLSHKEVAIAFKTTVSKLVESLEMLQEGKHYSYESVEYESDKSTSSILFFSKAGIMRIAYYLKTDEALQFLEFIEEIHLKDKGQKDTTHVFYAEIEELLKERLDKLKNNPEASLEEINHFILTLDNLIKKRDGNKSSGTSSITDIIETVVGLAQSYTTPSR